MDPADRLAAYLADELRADERAELEAALARDPGLRRMLAAMRRADEAVAQLDPPTPPEGFDHRLDAAVDAVLAETLDPSGTTSGTGGDAASGGPADDGAAWSHRQAADDELAARRRRVPTAALGAAAAGLVLLVGGVVVTQLVGDDRSATDQALDADTEAADLESADDAGDVDGPTVVADDREVDADDLDALLAADELTGLADQRLDELAGGDLARAYQVQLGQQPELRPYDDAPQDAPAGDESDAAPDQEVDDSAGDEVAPDVEADAEMDADQPDDGVDDGVGEDSRRQRGTALDPADLPEVRTREGDRLDDDATQDLARCLGEVLAGGPGAIPVYAELATFDGEDAVVLGLLTTEPAAGEFTRREVWALSRDDCQVLRFSQDDAPR